MFEQALIDGLKFAREGQRLQGSLPLSRLPQVAEVLFDSTGSVSYDLTGFVDGHGEPRLEMQTQARLGLICQRCLSRLDFELHRRTCFLLVTKEADLPALDEEESETETVLAETVANIVDLVEQEILLGLPMAPTHADRDCIAPVQSQATDADSPFAVLRKLQDLRHAD